jgi:endo-1,4-beta-xylanase
LGPAHIDSSFAWARAAAGPDIKLYYNEYFYHGASYGGTRIPSKIDFAYDVVSGLVSRGAPIDGMGFQSHIPAIGYPGKALVAADMRRFTDLGLEVYITELDVELTTPVTSEKLEQQALIYKEMFEIALENPGIKLVCLWQFNDAQSWLGAESESCIMDSIYNPKPAYDSIQAVLIGAGGLLTIYDEPIQTDEAFQFNSTQISILITEPAVLTISNLKGQVVNRLSVSKGNTIPISHLNSGIYIASLQAENRVWTIKFKI